MICTNCKTSFAQHELESGLCLLCTAKELEAARQQHAEALARERMLREQVENLMGDACEFIGPDEDGKPECLCCGMCLETVSHGHKADCLANKILQIKLSHPAPRVFTVEECRPLVEALKLTWNELEMGYIVGNSRPSECGECGSIGAHSEHCFQGKIEPALAHARKLEMDGGV